jgi:hypothetical protein
LTVCSLTYRAAGELLDEAAGDPGGEQRLAGRHHPNGRHQVLAGQVLEQEPAGPGPQGLEHVLVQVEGGQDQHPDRVGGPGAGQPAGRRQPVELGHADVHQDHVGP